MRRFFRELPAGARQRGAQGKNHLLSCPLIPSGAVGANGLLPLQRTAFGPLTRCAERLGRSNKSGTAEDMPSSL